MNKYHIIRYNWGEFCNWRYHSRCDLQQHWGHQLQLIACNPRRKPHHGALVRLRPVGGMVVEFVRKE